MARLNRSRLPIYFTNKGDDSAHKTQITQRTPDGKVQGVISHLEEARQVDAHHNLFPSRSWVPSQTHALEQGQWTPPSEASCHARALASPLSPVPRQFFRGIDIADRFAYRTPHASSVMQPRHGEEKSVDSIARTQNQPIEFAGADCPRAIMRPLYGQSSRNQSRPSNILNAQNKESSGRLTGDSFGINNSIGRQSRQQVRVTAPPTPRYSSPPFGLHQDQVPTSTTAATSPGNTELVSPLTLDKKFRSVFPYPTFNAVQSACFSNVYGSNYNVVVSAPTGSGKTVIFELAICKLAAQKEKKDFKIVYQAPTKALCSERARDWQAKFKPLGLQVVEFTGDTSAFEARRVRTASIIITTPEKWDSVTRKWSDHGTLLRSVKLVLIDEVHILKDMRGATLETVVSRMKSLGVEIRFVALSATIPNSNDIAQWLGLNHTSPQIPAKTFVFGEEYRPVRLEKIVHGYNLNGNEHSFDGILDDQLPNIITKYSQGKPVLIFCFTRRSCESAAMILADYWDMCSPESKPWPQPSVEIHGSTKLQGVVTRGVSYHHGGMDRQDRASVEDAFLRGHLSIICCTSTLAVGVNLPCHTVILKGTMGYQNGKFAEYDEFEVMQMIGRAGRPQFDTSAMAIILTRTETQDKYKAIGPQSQAIESTLHLNLIEHLNSEIVLGTISSLETALRWLEGTFLAIRVRKNPSHYQIPGIDNRARNFDEQLREICSEAIAQISHLRLLRYVDDGSSVFHATEYGRAMSSYMVKFETVKMILGIEHGVDTEQLLNAICRASEFDEFRIKSTERPILREINKTHDIPFKIKESITETWQKISILVQAELSREPLPHQQRIAIEARQASECLQRLLESYAICKIFDGDSHGLKVSLELTRSLYARAWEGHHTQLCQVPDIGPANMTKLVDKQITTVSEFASLTPVQIESFLSKNPTAAMKIVDALKSFPSLTLEGHIVRRKRSDGGDMFEPEAIAKVKFRHTNDIGLPRWKNKVPSVTFFAESGDGKLLHIWRGKLQEKSHPISFLVPKKDLDNVTCHITCDEVVGTIQSKQLSCLDGESDEIELLTTPYKIDPPKKSNLRRSPEYENLGHESKRQRLNKTYKVCSVTVGNTEFDCIDLSAVDENDTHEDRHGTYESLALKTPLRCKREDDCSSMSSCLRNSSVRTTMFGGTYGDGTSLNPWTVAESDTTEEFDTDIFDDMEVLGEDKLLADSEGERQNEPLDTKSDGTDSGPVFEKTLLQTDAGSLRASLGNETGSVQQDVTMVKMGSPGGTHESAEVEAQDGQMRLPPQAVIASLPGEDLMKEEQNEQKELSEPAWVKSSDRDLIDFLRGHVKFV